MAKTITTKRIRLDPTQARTSKAMGGLVVANKPPPASRHRAVLLLRKDVPLFDMQDNANAQDIIISSSNSRPMMMVETISTNRVSGVEDPRYVELMVSFLYTGKKSLFQEIDLQANNAEGLDTKDVSWRPELVDH
jgi:hypothetical protein